MLIVRVIKQLAYKVTLNLHFIEKCVIVRSL